MRTAIRRAMRIVFCGVNLLSLSTKAAVGARTCLKLPCALFGCGRVGMAVNLDVQTAIERMGEADRAGYSLAGG